jgi:hypothetical protein
MRSKQELERFLDQYDLDHTNQGGLAGAALKLYGEAGTKGLIAAEIADRLFPELPSDEREALGDILNRDLAGYDGKGWLRVLSAGGDINLRLRLARKSVWQMQGHKLLDAEGAPKLAMVEIRDGHYWDGESFEKNDGTPAVDGFYFCELTSSGSIVQGDDGGETLFGPYATAAEAEHAMRDLWLERRAIAALTRVGLLHRRVGDDGKPRYYVGVLSPEGEKKAWKRIESKYSEAG